ncbi:uncharacterized protein G6M90_00g069400 [Metarhizium brunneum]|uniref:Uncharacterized protein n=1 Tax=Metarhizium brunneum TaxID=500148 RepID=A0A7D5YVC0_9HYPO|nr:hypothetical protein G6M90_00g069400 [Metarhizium brunneum]
MSIFDNDSLLKKFYDNAAHQDEFASNAFWTKFLTHYVFNEIEWHVFQEMPPKDHHDQTRFDIGVVYLELTCNVLAFRLTAEGKKNKSGKEDIITAERHAYRKSLTYLRENQIPSLWVMTYFGTHARLWFCSLDGPGALELFYPLAGEMGQKSAYPEFRANEQGFRWAFNCVKSIQYPDSGKIAELYTQSESLMGLSSVGMSQTTPSTTYQTYDYPGGDPTSQSKQASSSTASAQVPTTSFSITSFDQPVISQHYGTTPMETDVDEPQDQSASNNTAAPSQMQGQWFSSDRPPCEIEVLRRRGHPIHNLVFKDRKKNPVTARREDFVRATHPDGRRVYVYRYSTKTTYWCDNLDPKH